MENKFIGNVLKIADVHHGTLSDGLKEFIQNTIQPTYRDQVLKEHIYNINDPEDFDEHVPEELQKEFDELREEMNAMDAGYIRITF